MLTGRAICEDLEAQRDRITHLIDGRHYHSILDSIKLILNTVIPLFMR